MVVGQTPISHAFHTGTAVFRVAAELGRACFKLERLGHKLATLSKGNPSIFFVQVLWQARYSNRLVRPIHGLDLRQLCCHVEKSAKDVLVEWI